MADLTDEDYDDMHHAIGRPKGSLKGSYRNYYCTTAGGPQARNFEASPYWDFRRFINEGQDAIYSVNIKGLNALEKWLAARIAVKVGLALSSGVAGGLLHGSLLPNFCLPVIEPNIGDAGGICAQIPRLVMAE